MKKAILCVTGIFLAGLVYAQSDQSALRKKDNPKGFAELEQQMYRNPQTGKIPRNIRNKELKYVRSSKAQLQLEHNPQARSAGSNQATWTDRGPFNVGGRTRAIGIDPRNENIIMAGGASGGLFRSTDGGTTWSRVSASAANPSITGLAQDPTAQNTWYYITGETTGTVSTNTGGAQYVGDGAYKSTDNGATWTQLASTKPQNPNVAGQGNNSDWHLCHDIAIDPINGAVLVANDGGIYRSSDGGSTWTKVIDAKGQFDFGDMTHLDVVKVDASNKVFYAATHSSGTDQGFYRSTDGITWTKLSNPTGWSGSWERIRVSAAASNSNIVWFLAHGSQLQPKTDQLLRYDHSNTQWTDFSDKLPSLAGNVGNYNTQGSYNMVMRVKPDDANVVFIAGTKLFRSIDAFASSANANNSGNTTWIGGYSPDNDISSYPNHHPDVHELVFYPSDPKKALCGHDGGISFTQNILANEGVPTGKSIAHPVTWEAKNNGYFTTQAYVISIDEATSGSQTILTGFQDNGNWRTTSGSSSATWEEQPYGGDGAWNAIAPGGATWYISQQNGTVQRITSNNTNGPGVNPSAAGSSSANIFISPFILDRNDANIMYYAAKKDLWRNNSISTINDGGGPFNGTTEGWEKLALGVTVNGNITAMQTSKTPVNTLYIGTSTGEIYKIENAHTGNTVSAVDIYTGKGMPAGFVSSIDVDVDDVNKVYVTFSNYGVKSIFFSTNGGTSWTDISGNLEENTDGSGNGPAIRWFHVFKGSDNSRTYFVGASTGLYMTTTLNGTSTSWTQEGATSIGNVPVSMVKSRTADGFVAIGTHGKGMFSATISSGGNDTTAPTVSSLNPADNATDVSITTNLQITFSETVVAGTGNINIKASSNDALLEAVDVTSNKVTISGSTATINPAANLANGTGYYVEVPQGGFKDAANNNFAGITDKTTWNFTTAQADNTAPTISSLSPADGASTVNIADNLVITFSENVQAGSGNIEIKKSADDQTQETISVTSQNVSINGAVVTINPSNDLAYMTDYYVQIAQGAFKDAANNEFAGITDKTTWNFTTDMEPDQTAPTISSLNPADEAVDVSISTNLEITFDENVQKGTGNVDILQASDNTIYETVSVTSSDVSINGAVVTINTTIALDHEANYYVHVSQGGFQDMAGNNFAGIADNTTWNFTTVKAPDNTPPSISALNPANSATEIAVNTDLSITFDENIQKGTGNIVVMNESTQQAHETIDVSTSGVTVANEVATINIANDLAEGTKYHVLIDNGAFRDLADNAFAGITSATTWNFSTVPATGIDDLEISDHMVVHTISGGIRVKFLKGTVRGADIFIYNLEGQLMQPRAAVFARENSVNVKANLTPGVYIVLAYTGEKLYRYKLVTK